MGEATQVEQQKNRIRDLHIDRKRSVNESNLSDKSSSHSLSTYKIRALSKSWFEASMNNASGFREPLDE